MIGDLNRAKGLIEFLHAAIRLKTTPRTGWLDRGVFPEHVESVADHSFQVALLAWTVAAADPTLDRDRILKLALIHDLPESLIGDYTPYAPEEVPDSGADRAAWRAFLDRRQTRSPQRTAAKRSAERAAMQSLLSHLQGNARIELAALWHEIEEGVTAEARFVKQADKLEAWMQSRAYLKRDPDLPMASFAAEIDDVLTHPALVAIRDAAKPA